MDFTEKRAQQDNRIMKLFANIGVEYITHPIAKTNKGSLELMLRKGENAINYRFMFDSVPVEDELNDQLKELYSIS
jgi:hypothetical protein